MRTLILILSLLSAAAVFSADAGRGMSARLPAMRRLLLRRAAAATIGAGSWPGNQGASPRPASISG